METIFKYSLSNLQYLHLIETPEISFEEYMTDIIITDLRSQSVIGDIQITIENDIIIAEIKK